MLLSLTGICIRFLDHPVAELVFNRYLSYQVDLLLAAVPRLVSLALVIGAFLALVLIVSPGRLKHKGAMAARAGVSLALSYCFVSLVLKPVFGRNGPLPWIWHGIDQFVFWGGGEGPYSFPSGHAALIMAVSATLWLSAPGHRIFAMLIAVAGCAALVALDLHFVSDVVAGGGIGAFVAYCVHTFFSQPAKQMAPA
jgi:membrane-associated phospholipid phosphatase